ncbi:hypothetical protein [Burkholderia vietnamiensis]|uniref:hypothetical protein n=1 Tax=Burkholderia vietnamiensis TaxID=60552 RepID=UPI002653967F|nr:hypothetical protein [Burkholderia vietnamiensis]MDN8065930.1 hypothetical protein [Burkholderia vietnamiensis]
MRLNLFNRANFTVDDEKKIRDLLAAPELEKILDRVEQTHIDERIALRKQLDTLDKRHDPAIAEAEAARIEAAKKLDAARAQFDAAKQSDKDAAQAVNTLECLKRDDDYLLRKQLIESRDTRLDTFRDHADNALQQLRHLISITSAKHKSWATGEKYIEYTSNADRVEACRELVKQAIAATHEMTLQPLTRAEVSERLTEWTHKLEPSLDAFGLPCPRLDEKGEVTTHRPLRPMHEVLSDNGLAERGDIPPDFTGDATKSPRRRAQ